MPFESELLSSWLYRLARVNVSKVHTFCRKYFPDQPVWNRDIDKLAPTRLLKQLSKKSGVPFKTVFATSLRSFEGKLFEKLNSHGNSKWIMPLGIYHRVRRKFGLQFCPSCLSRDGVHPYFRKYWRLSLYVVCPRCGVFLYDRCPNCGKPIAFHRNEQGVKNTLISIPICYCSSCKTDLRKVTSVKCSNKLKQIQRRLHDYILRGSTSSIPYSHTYFDVLYQVITLMNSKSKKLTSFQEEISYDLGFDRVKRTVRSDFDSLSIEHRINLIISSIWVLDKWPKRFLKICLRSNMTSSSILRDFENAPYWFYKIVMDNRYFANPLNIPSGRIYVNDRII